MAKKSKLYYGITLGFNHQNQFNSDSFYLKQNLLKWGFTAQYKINKNFSLQSKLLLNISTPSKSSIQEKIQENLNPTSGSQTFDLEIALSIFTQSSLQFNYNFNAHKKWQPYVGIGINNIISQSSKSTQKVTIDPTNISSG